MSWTRIMAPLCGGPGDEMAVQAASKLAQAFGAELACVYAPVDVADVMPWTTEGFTAGVQTAALETLREAAAAGEGRARQASEACAYAGRRFTALDTPVWANLAAESRLSDVVVFGAAAARGQGPLADAFQQILADEQRPVLVAREPFEVGGVVAVAWDGGKEASRAARLAMPLLERAGRVVILAALKSSERHFDPAKLQAYYAGRGVQSEIRELSDCGDVCHLLVDAAREAHADVLVAGAFGHPRLQEFIFGGTTRSLLNSQTPTLFLSH